MKGRFRVIGTPFLCNGLRLLLIEGEDGLGDPVWQLGRGYPGGGWASLRLSPKGKRAMTFRSLPEARQWLTNEDNLRAALAALRDKL